jgi:hypothetical protein
MRTPHLSGYIFVPFVEPPPYLSDESFHAAENFLDISLSPSQGHPKVCICCVAILVQMHLVLVIMRPTRF